MRLAASRNSVLRSSVGGGPAGPGRRASPWSSRGSAARRPRRGLRSTCARARRDDRQDLRLELLHLHVDHADLAQVVGLERAQLRRAASRAPPRAPRAGRAGSGAATDKVDQPAEDALAVDAQPVVVVLAGHPGAQVGHRRRRLLGERALDVEVLGVDRRRRPGPRWRRSTSSSYSRGHSCAASSSAASRAGASAPYSSNIHGKMCSAGEVARRGEVVRAHALAPTSS